MRLTANQKKKLHQNYGPWALITGASSGIGQALAETLADAKFNVILCARREEILEELAVKWRRRYQVEVLVMATDLAQMANVKAMVNDIHELPIGLFIAAAGFGTSGDFIAADTEAETAMVNVNILAPMLLTHYFGRKLAEQGRGGILLMSSIVAFQGVPHAAHYAATKAYVQSLAEGLYHELKPYGVAVLSAAPGPVDSGFAPTANLQMGTALQPADIAVPIFRALGKRATVFPGRLTKILRLGLRTVPRWGKVRIMKKVMAGMTEHQK
jgi:uncharacterized protein